MKIRLSLVMLAAAAMSVTACNEKKEGTDAEMTANDTVAAHGHDEHDGHGHDHDAEIEIEAPVDVTINGKVGEITFGKDGYTAQLKDDSGREYFVTISRANLDDPKQYMELKAGDKITVKGESFKLDDKLHIKVEELKLKKPAE